MRAITGAIRRLTVLDEAELASAAKDLGAPADLVRTVAADGRLPVVLFCAGGIATPADAALMIALGAEGVFVRSGMFKSEDRPPGTGDRRGDDALAGPRAGSRPPRAAGAGNGGLESSKLEGEQLLAQRGWWHAR